MNLGKRPAFFSLKKGGRGKYVGALAIFLILAFSSTFVHFLSDWLWFEEVGYTKSFTVQVFSRFLLGVPVFAVLFAFLYIFAAKMRDRYYKTMAVVDQPEKRRQENRLLGIVAAGSALIFSALVSSSLWFDILEFFNATSFGQTDPIYRRDISFYMFQLPLMTQVLRLLTAFLVFLILLTAVIYLVLASKNNPLEGQTYVEEPGSNVTFLRNKGTISQMRKRILEVALGQVMIIAVLLFLIIALRNFLAGFLLLYSPAGVVYGAGYTDIHVTAWIYRIQTALALLSAGLLGVARLRKNRKLALAGPFLMILVMLGGLAAQAFVQGVVVSPNEIAKERPYIKHSLDFTKKAYKLDNIERIQYDVQQNLTEQELKANQDTINNISINDYKPTLEAFNQLQGLRGYYQFADVDIDRYQIDGKPRQVFLSARELNPEGLSPNSRTWVNQYLKYTHGYGVTVAPVNQVNSSGQPEMIVRNVPVVSDAKELQVERPQIYFGEKNNTYAIVNTNEDEFDYPSGDNAQTFRYDGTAGIKLDFLRRVLFAADQGSFKMLVSGGLGQDSKILLHRNILERAKKIAPFLHYDEDAYVVIADKKLYYIIDAFTYSNRFPYAEPFSKDSTDINYLRNSVKVVVDAYNGETNFYVAEQEPMIQTYQKIFPGLFKSLEQMPDALRSHLRYPQYMFDIQSHMLGRFHMNQPELFYDKGDNWQIGQRQNAGSAGAKNETGGQSQEMESLYFTLRLPKEKDPEFVLTIPYTPTGKPNMTAFLVARNDGEAYGQLRLYEFPRNRLVLGPEQATSRIASNDVISRERTLWGSKGSSVIDGDLLTVPIGNSILYIEPLYIRADTQSAIPEVKRIILVYQDKVIMEDTLEKALQSLFKSGAQTPVAGTPPEASSAPGSSDPALGKNQQELVVQAKQTYEQAQNALRAGSLAQYEMHIKRLGEILQQLEQIQTP